MIDISRKEQLSEVAHQLAPPLLALGKRGGVVGLRGNLGAGKTTFVGELLRVWGCPDAVASPTFVLERRYQLDTGFAVSHWDLYRLREAPEELLAVVEPGELRLIEWPERAADTLRLDAELLFCLADDGARTLTVSWNSVQSDGGKK